MTFGKTGGKRVGKRTSVALTLASLLALAAGAEARVRSKQIVYEHAGQKLTGYLAWDDSHGDARRPGILIVHEWWGLNDYAKRRADQLAAEEGYVAFAADMYGSKVTDHPAEAGGWAKEVSSNVEAWRARAMAGLDVLKKQASVDPKRIAAIGYCFGGGTVVQLAYAGADLAGVVSFHGSLPLPGPGDAARTKAAILVCHGDADGFVGADQAHAFQKAMADGGFDWMFVSYGGAKHGFTNADAGKYGLDGLRYDAKADRRSWAQMRQFFLDVFAPKG